MKNDTRVKRAYITKRNVVVQNHVGFDPSIYGFSVPRNPSVFNKATDMAMAEIYRY